MAVVLVSVVVLDADPQERHEHNDAETPIVSHGA